MRLRLLVALFLALPCFCGEKVQPSAAAIEAAVKSFLPNGCPRSISQPFIDLFVQRAKAGGDVQQDKRQLSSLLSPIVAGEDGYGTASRVLESWKKDGNEMPSGPEFRRQWGGVRDWNAYYTLTYLPKVLAAYPDWQKLVAYAHYKSTAKEPVGLSAYYENPDKFKD